MTTMVVVPVRCGDGYHFVDIDTEYKASIRSHTEEDIATELTIKDLCPEYEMAGCVEFLTNLEDQKQECLDMVDDGGRRSYSDTEILSGVPYNSKSALVYAIDYSDCINANIMAAYLAKALKNIIMMSELADSMVSVTDEAIPPGELVRDLLVYLDSIVQSHGLIMDESYVFAKFAHTDNYRFDTAEYRNLFRVIDSAITVDFGDTKNGIVNAITIVGNISDLYKESLVRRFDVNAAKSPARAAAKWSNALLHDTLNKESKRLGGMP